MQRDFFKREPRKKIESKKFERDWMWEEKFQGQSLDFRSQNKQEIEGVELRGVTEACWGIWEKFFDWN